MTIEKTIETNNFYNYFLQKKLEQIRSKRRSEIFSEYRTTDPLTFSRNYNISLNDDGSVFDKDLKISYNTLSEWMKGTKRMPL